MVNSGSSANLLMIAAMFFRKNNPLKRGDEIIVPAVSWSTTYSPLQQYGLHVKFVDIDKNTLNIDLEKLKSAITDKTKAILLVNLLGNPNDFDKIREIIGTRNITILEDNCESMGSSYNDKQTGTFGKMGTYSCFFSHHISTMEGGLIVTDNEEFHHILLSLRAHGWTRNLPENNHLCTKMSDLFKEHFRFLIPGYNVRPLEMSGAIGIEQLKKLPSMIAKRRENARIFQDNFANDERFIIQKEIGKSSWFGFAMIIKPEAGIERSAIIAKLTEAKIETRPIVTGDMTKCEMLKYFDYELAGSMENAELIDSNGFFVGNHDVDIAKNIALLRNILNVI
ncbi:Putative pyridoxal-phosphate-dependent aminoacid transferase [Candidatus Deianiraea vastatrix]|uniref:Pyridoxal-phosphate-dependent aminoacid transferase n=1 Tax=Candidatus Deianiraea vastatrix TaxID=2163644 RepID=A0A5B8XF15_9RICK|nr:Putative pyridoxal-phosphate-dependent aminoacid transferase [Candidatus Deianiraea vastatrix]